MEFFEIEGRKIFTVPGPGGGPGSRLSAVIIQKRPTDGCYNFGREGLHEEYAGRWYVIEWSYVDPPSVFEQKTQEAVAALLA